MGIDKIRKRKKKTKKYKKRIPFWAGGESYGGDPSAGADDGGPGSGPSGPSGPDGPSNGSDNSEPGISPAPTPTPTTNFSDNSEPGVSPTPTVNFSDTNEPGVSPVATTSLLYDGPTYDEEVGINTPPTTPVNFSDTNEPGINPGPTMPVNYTDNSEPGINPGLYNPPTYVDNSNDNRLGILNNQNFAPIKDPKGGFKQGLMSLLKNLALSLIPGLLPAQLAKVYQTYTTGKNIYNTAKYVGNKFDPDLTKTLDNKFKTALTKGPSGTKPPTGFNDNDNNEGNALVAKNVIAKSVQEYSPKQLTTIQKYRDVLQGAVDKGEVLNEIGQQTLTEMNQVLKQYQV